MTPTTGGTPAIEVRGLTKRFGAVTAVDDLSFTAAAGRVTGFLGPNGSGKTTTLRVLLGLVRPDAGAALLGGRPHQRIARPGAAVGAVLEHAGFHPGRSGRDHLRVLAVAGGVPDAGARVERVLADVGLAAAAGRRVGGWSLGMRQRLGIAAALLGDPAALVLDEPTNGLDPPGIRWVRRLVRAEAERGRAVLVSSHLLAEVAPVVDDVVIVAGGRLRASGPLADLAGGRSLEDLFFALTEGEDGEGNSGDDLPDGIYGAVTTDGVVTSDASGTSGRAGVRPVVGRSVAGRPVAGRQLAGRSELVGCRP